MLYHCRERERYDRSLIYSDNNKGEAERKNELVRPCFCSDRKHHLTHWQQLLSVCKSLEPSRIVNEDDALNFDLACFPFIARKSGANNSFLGREAKRHLSVGASCTSLKGRQLWTKPDQVGKERMRESYARDDAVRDLLQLVVRLVVRSWSLRKFSLRSRKGQKLE